MGQHHREQGEQHYSGPLCEGRLVRRHDDNNDYYDDEHNHKYKFEHEGS